MFKKFSTISLATLATVGAMALSVESASAGSIKIRFGGHFGHHHHWKPYYGHGWGYHPVYVSAPVKSCYFVKRFGELVKVCRYPTYY
jgi:hypothetical protein